MPSKIEIPHIEIRSKWQYMVAPLKAFAVTICLFFIISSSFSNNSSFLPTNSIPYSNLLGKVEKTKPTNNLNLDHHSKFKAKHNSVSETEFYEYIDHNKYRIIALVYLVFAVLFFGGLTIATIMMLALPTFAAVLIIFAKSQPTWLRTWHQGVARYYFNFISYTWLMTDKFPKIDGSQDLLLIEFDVQEVKDMSRLLPLVKWIITIPQLILSTLAFTLSSVLISFLWPYLLITGKSFPKTLQSWINGYLEWQLSYWNYSIFFVTDEYPKVLFSKKTL